MKNDASIDPALKENEFRVSEVPPGSALLVGKVAVFNIAGSFCAIQGKWTHRQGSLSEGKLDGSTVTWYHGTQFSVCTGVVLRGLAKDPLLTFRVIVEGDIGRVEASPPSGLEKDAASVVAFSELTANNDPYFCYSCDLSN